MEQILTEKVVVALSAPIPRLLAARDFGHATHLASSSVPLISFVLSSGVMFTSAQRKI